MMVDEPSTRLVINIRYTKDYAQVDHDVYEGEVRMTQEQQDQYAWALGDGNASVTVGRELSESDYGNGGKVFVSVTLKCGQNSTQIEYALQLAKKLSELRAWEAHQEMKNQLVERGILKP